MASVQFHPCEPGLNALAAAAAAAAAGVKLRPQILICQALSSASCQCAGVVISVQEHARIATGATLAVEVVRAWCFPDGLPRGHLRL